MSDAVASGASVPAPIGRKRAAFIAVVLAYAGLVLGVVKGIVLVPIYFRYFSLGAYGAWLASANIVGLLGLLDLGFGTVFYQRLGEAFGAKDFDRFARLAGCALAITIVTTPVFIALGAIAAPFVPGLVNAESSLRRPLAITFALTAAGSALDLAWMNVTAVTHAWQRTAVAGWARILVQLVEVVGTVVSLWLGLGIVAFGVGALAGALVGTTFSAVSAIRIWRQLRLPKPRFDEQELKSLVSTSIPVFLSRIVGHVAANIDVALVSALVNPAAAAVYGLTDRLFRFALSFINPIAGSTLSALAHLMGEVGTKGVARPLRELFAVWSSVAALCFPVLLAMNRDFVGIWVGSDKYGGVALSIAICVSTLVTARSFLMYIVLTGLGEIRLTAWLAVLEPALRIPLMVLLLRFLGPAGLPLATSLGIGLLSLVVYPTYVARKIELSRREGFALQMRAFPALVATMAVGAAVAILIPTVHHWPAFIAKTAVVFAGVAVTALISSAAFREQVSLGMARARRLLSKRSMGPA
jgi:O-antigen/teichoic acid export membrane protein